MTVSDPQKYPGLSTMEGSAASYLIILLMVPVVVGYKAYRWVRDL